MSWSFSQPAVSRRALLGCALGSLAVGVTVGVVFMAMTAEAQVQKREFATGAGMIIHYVNPSKTADFEAVMRRVKDALAKSENQVRQQQANGWTLYKAQEPGPNNAAMYLWVIDPAPSGADYTVATILNEAFPTEVQKLYTQFNESYAGGQQPFNLQRVMSFGN